MRHPVVGSLRRRRAWRGGQGSSKTWNSARRPRNGQRGDRRRRYVHNETGREDALSRCPQGAGVPLEEAPRQAEGSPRRSAGRNMSPDDRAQYLECMLCLDQVLVSVLCAALAGTLAAFSMRIPVVILVACAIGFY